MGKRMLATVLWIYAAWYAAALLGSLIGAPMLGALGAILGAAIAMAAKRSSAMRADEAT